MLSFTKKNNSPTTVAAQTVEPPSSPVAVLQEPSSPSIKKTLLHRASRRVQKLLGLKKSVVAQLAPEPRVVFELGPASDPYRNHARLSPTSSFAAHSQGADHTRTTTTHHINRYSVFDSLLPVVVIPSSASPCPALSPTSSFSSSLESKSLTTLEGGEVAHPHAYPHAHAHSTYTGTADADKGAGRGLTRADRAQRQRPALTSSSRSHSSSSSSNPSDSSPSLGIYTIVPASVIDSSFVVRPWEKKKGTELKIGMGMGMEEGYSREAVEEIRRGVKEVGAARCGHDVSHVPVEVLEGECEVVVEWM